MNYKKECEALREENEKLKAELEELKVEHTRSVNAVRDKYVELTEQNEELNAWLDSYQEDLRKEKGLHADTEALCNLYKSMFEAVAVKTFGHDGE